MTHLKTRGSVLPGGERLEREADQTPSSNAEVKNECSYTAALPMRAFMVWSGTALPLQKIST